MEYSRTREDFRDRTGVTFDPVSAAESAADITLNLLLNPQRAARLVQFHAADDSQPSLEEVIAKLLGATWKAKASSGLAGQVQRATDSVFLYRLMTLFAAESAPAQVRATALAKLAELRTWLAAQRPADAGLAAFFQFGLSQIKHFQDDPKAIGLPRPSPPPPGMPIGDDSFDFVVH
jgi:hypothetical protein